MEQQISRIEVVKENLRGVESGGAYRKLNVEITVDSSKDIYLQRIAATHEILGAYLGAVIDREVLEQIAESICDKLEELIEEK